MPQSSLGATLRFHFVEMEGREEIKKNKHIRLKLQGFKVHCIAKLHLAPGRNPSYVEISYCKPLGPRPSIMAVAFYTISLYTPCYRGPLE
ncbi:hypothetical protein EVAR_94833_1 [Eumeta japonica]|uniref:Uncharacterized protein n=1 Tax=Eumeta variegata TaxID=151549 RepID=A0A4C1UH55_EUMVA|nr:hypothetical protein EVAR_94833_1 [Eumeta japonica]